jgi:hypothetical protein
MGGEAGAAMYRHRLQRAADMATTDDLENMVHAGSVWASLPHLPMRVRVAIDAIWVRNLR